MVSCILGGSIKPVIPEVAKRLSGIQRNISLLDTGSRPPQADSSGMTIVFSYRDFQQSAREKFNNGQRTTGNEQKAGGFYQGDSYEQL